MIMEKNIKISHSNFIYFIGTAKGKYAIKFYPTWASKTINLELILNKLLLRNGLLTPFMHNKKNVPFIKTCEYLAACYDYIEGKALYEQDIDHKIIKEMNESLLKIKTILADAKINSGITTYLENEDISKKINFLTYSSENIDISKNKRLIDRVIKYLSTAYIINNGHFTPKPIHANASLSNIILYENKVYLLDLSHVKLDYELNDLAHLIISCFFHNISSKIIKMIILSYFNTHNLDLKKLRILTFFIQLGLIKEYFRIYREEKQARDYKSKPEGFGIYLSEIEKRKNLITCLIKQLSFERKIDFYP